MALYKHVYYYYNYYELGAEYEIFRLLSDCSYRRHCLNVECRLFVLRVVYLLLQLTAAGRTGRRGTNAARHVVEVKGHALAAVTAPRLHTEVVSVMEIHSSSTTATTHLVQVALCN